MPSNAKKTPALVKRGDTCKETRGLVSERLSDLLDKMSKNFVMTGADLAEKADISEGIISGYRQNKNTPSVAKLKNMAIALGVNADYLLGLSEIPKGNAHDTAIAEKLGLSKDAITALVRFNKGHSKDFVSAVNAFIDSVYFCEIINAILDAKAAKLHLDYNKSLSVEEMEAIYKNSDEWKDDIFATKKTSKAKRLALLKECRKKYDLERWRVSYALNKLLDTKIDSLDLPGVQSIAEMQQEQKRLGLSDNDYLGHLLQGGKAPVENHQYNDALDKLLSRYKPYEETEEDFEDVKS
jgi:transcriptional regulator with XRE-family HTH domain